MSIEPPATFQQLALAPAILSALEEVGYETPSPIQARTIPLILEGKDVLGQAQTGTGKTAAFALPLLSRLDLQKNGPQCLVLTPTRELAIQVAEAFQRYASKLSGFHVLPIYGGQEYGGQIRALKRGVHVVVGTPGRVMDHMRRGTLNLSMLSSLVLDEADEMLRMGFIDDVQWILEQTPEQRQIALFSATMPEPIRRIANQHLHDPQQITIQVKTATADTIRQRYWPVSGLHKLDALTRILEAESFDAMIIFVRTKTATVELAEKLEARGFSSAPLNGDIPQQQRERTVEQLKRSAIDIIVATDVAARGLDVDRISHVVNYDIPYDSEAYIHRIGRTGRAGRHGDAILFVAPREKRLLGSIEKATGKKIELMELPSSEMINNKRIEKFKQQITDTLESNDLNLFRDLIEQYHHEHDRSVLDIAAALARMQHGDEPFLLRHTAPTTRPKRENTTQGNKAEKGQKDRKRTPRNSGVLEKGMERFRIEVGHQHRVKPGNIVGAIANEAGIDSQYIGHIDIQDSHSLVDLPEGMPDDIFHHLKKVRVAGLPLKISRHRPGAAEPAKDNVAAAKKDKKRKLARSTDKKTDGKKSKRKGPAREKKRVTTARKPRADKQR